MSAIGELFKLFGTIGVDSSEAERGIDNVNQKAKKSGSKLGAFAKKAVKVGAIVGTAFVGIGTAAFAMTKKVVGNLVSISENSAKLGVTTDFYQEMDYWAKQNGISSQQMDRALGRLNQRIGRAAAGNEKYSAALENLGVDMDGVRNGTISTEDAFATTIKTLSEMTNEQEQSAAASELFGTKLARDLMPALQDGSMTIDEAKEKAKELGLVMDEEAIKAAEEFESAWIDLTSSLQAVGTKIITYLIPIFQSMMEWVNDHMPQIQATFEFVFGAIGLVIDQAKSWISGLKQVIHDWVGDNEGQLNSLWEFYKRYLSFIGEKAQEVFSFISDTVKQILPPVVEFIKEILNQILTFWSENGEQILDAANKVWNAIKAVLDFLMPVIKFLIVDTWNAIKNVIQGALDVILGLVKVFSSALTGDWRGMWDGIKQLLSGAVQLIWGLINLWFVGKIFKLGKTFFKLFKGVFTKGWKAITNLFTKSTSKIKNVVSTAFNSIKSTATRIFNAVKNAMTKPITAAKNTVKRAIDAIKGFFSRLKLKFPKIKAPKLPRFSLKGKFSLAPPSVPKLSISWHKLGGIFNKPTLFNGVDGLHGVGEADPEAIIPLNAKTLGGIGEGISKTMNGNSSNDTGILASLLTELIKAVKEGKNIILDGEVIASYVDDNMTNNFDLEAFMRGDKG